MTDMDVEHWRQIAGRTKIHKVPAGRKDEAYKNKEYAWRTRARKESEEE